MADDNGLNAVKTDVAILKKDVSNIQGLLGKLDTAIDKIADATNGISRILAVHESKLEEVNADLIEAQARSERSDELLHKRISEKEAEAKEVAQDNHEALMDFLQDHDDRSSTVLENIAGRVRVLEQWRWVVLGGGAAILYLLSESKILEALS